ncbi:MAG: DUF2303 family protein [Pseudomonadota bacterium]|nr:DUF2303 family protein [Pseudomonadota bacterium]
MSDTVEFTGETGAGVVERVMREMYKPEIVDIGFPGAKSLGLPPMVPVALIPQAGGVHLAGVRDQLEKWRLHPERRTGTASVTDLGSFADHVERFKTASTALFATADERRTALSLQAVYDYHDDVNASPTPDDARPGWCQHRLTYSFPLSPEWKAWIAASGQWLEQAEFAMLLEDRIVDVIAPPDLNRTDLSEPDRNLKELLDRFGGRRLAGADKVLELSRGLSIVTVDETVSMVNLDTGEGRMTFASKNQDAAGQVVTVPNAFLIAIPVFDRGASYRLPVRLRYRKRGASVTWMVEVMRAWNALDDAWREACDGVAERVDLPLFYGSPER